MPVHGKYWINRKLGRRLGKSERPRRERLPADSRRERRDRLRKEAKDRRVQAILASVIWSCRYFDDCKRCGCFCHGYCSKDGLSCVRVDRFKRRRDFRTGSNPFDALNWGELFAKKSV